MRPLSELYHKKKSQLEFLAQKEAFTCYQKGQSCSFITLTYDDEYIPLTKDESGNIHMTLQKRDAQNFLKRLRAAKEYYKDKTPFKVLYCGEYGENYGRPHLHMAMLGLSDAQIQAYTTKTWKSGLVDIGTLGNGGVRYIIDYMQKTQFNMHTKLMNEALGIENPFLNHSCGLGKEWLLQHEQEIIDNNFRVCGNLLPKSAIEFIAHRNGLVYKDIIIKAIKEKYHNAEGWRELELEDSLLKEKWLIEGLRSKGQQIQQWQLQERKWAKVRSHHDRNYWKPLIEKCL